MSSDAVSAAHMTTMNIPNILTPADIDLTGPLQDGLKAYIAANSQIDPAQWESMPAAVKAEMGNRFLPFLWHSLPGILDQVNAKNTESAGTLNVPDSLEGLL